MNELPRPSRILAIGLDSADLDLVQSWCCAGELPELADILASGASGRLIGAAGYTAETPWTTLLTGCQPHTTGYWSPAKYGIDYSVKPVGAFDYAHQGHFYDYCRGKQVIVFDVPQARLSPHMEGLQILSWGAHSPQGPTGSNPPDLLERIVAKHGTHPTLFKDDFLVWQTDRGLEQLEAGFLEGIRRRTAIALDLMRDNPWDLFLLAYGEPHSAGHGFWHLSRPDHPLYHAYARAGCDPLLNIYKEVDRSLGILRRAMPADARLLVFSQEGMKSNSADLPSWLFLPELLFRWRFGREALAKGDPSQSLGPATKQPEQEWLRALWGTRETHNPLARFADRHLCLRISQAIENVLETGPRLRHPLDCSEYGYMPQMWYQPFWPAMKAFALPSFSEGNVRINVAGREAQGVVAPSEFERVGDEIVSLVRQMADPRTGRSIVRDVLRPRSEPHGNPKGPDADIIFLWQPEPTAVVDTLGYGRIGPVPFRRTGDHHNTGFFAVTGPGLRPVELPDGDLADLAPTILDLMGAPLPNHFDGSSRVPALVQHG